MSKVRGGEIEEKGRRKNEFRIGISGVSRSGKSTLTKRLFNMLGGKKNVDVLSQDWFFDRIKIATVLKGNWEHPDSIDHRAMREEAAKIVEEKKPIHIYEGFICFHDSALVKTMDVMIWLELPKEIAKKRRMATKCVSESYYEEKVWKFHTQYAKRTRANAWWKAVVVIDATRPIEEVAEVAARAIRGSDAFPSADPSTT
eukprot:g3396.t1